MRFYFILFVIFLSKLMAIRSIEGEGGNYLVNWKVASRREVGGLKKFSHVFQMGRRLLVKIDKQAYGKNPVIRGRRWR